jgi:hypothetical protein
VSVGTWRVLSHHELPGGRKTVAWHPDGDKVIVVVGGNLQVWWAPDE